MGFRIEAFGGVARRIAYPTRDKQLDQVHAGVEVLPNHPGDLRGVIRHHRNHCASRTSRGPDGAPRREQAGPDDRALLNRPAQREIGAVAISTQPDGRGTRAKILLETADPAGEVLPGLGLDLNGDVGTPRVDADVRMKINEPGQERAAGERQGETRGRLGTSGFPPDRRDAIAGNDDVPGFVRKVVDPVDQPVRLNPEHARRSLQEGYLTAAPVIPAMNWSKKKL